MTSVVAHDVNYMGKSTNDCLTPHAAAEQSAMLDEMMWRVCKSRRSRGRESGTKTGVISKIIQYLPMCGVPHLVRPKHGY